MKWPELLISLLKDFHIQCWWKILAWTPSRHPLFIKHMDWNNFQSCTYGAIYCHKYQKSINWGVLICESQFVRIPILMLADVSFDSKLTKTHISWHQDWDSYKLGFAYRDSPIDRFLILRRDFSWESETSNQNRTFSLKKKTLKECDI